MISVFIILFDTNQSYTCSNWKPSWAMHCSSRIGTLRQIWAENSGVNWAHDSRISSHKCDFRRERVHVAALMSLQRWKLWRWRARAHTYRHQSTCANGGAVQLTDLVVPVHTFAGTVETAHMSWLSSPFKNKPHLLMKCTACLMPTTDSESVQLDAASQCNCTLRDFVVYSFFY